MDFKLNYSNGTYATLGVFKFTNGTYLAMLKRYCTYAPPKKATTASMIVNIVLFLLFIFYLCATKFGGRASCRRRVIVAQGLTKRRLIVDVDDPASNLYCKFLSGDI